MVSNLSSWHARVLHVGSFLSSEMTERHIFVRALLIKCVCRMS